MKVLSSNVAVVYPIQCKLVSAISFFDPDLDSNLCTCLSTMIADRLQTSREKCPKQWRIPRNRRCISQYVLRMSDPTNPYMELLTVEYGSRMGRNGRILAAHKLYSFRSAVGTTYSATELSRVGRQCALHEDDHEKTGCPSSLRGGRRMYRSLRIGPSLPCSAFVRVYI